jgi:hypothetical protein
MTNDRPKINDELNALIREAMLETYDASVPIRTEFVGALARPDFGFWWVLHPYGEFELDGTQVSIDVVGNDYVARIHGLKSESQHVALSKADELFTIALAAISLRVQQDQERQEEGHVRLVFRRDEISIEPWKNYGPGKGALGRSHPVALVDCAAYGRGTPHLRALMVSFYAALAPTAHDAKFYSAFATIEYIEKSFVSRISTTELATDEDVSIVAQLVGKELTTLGYAPKKVLEIQRRATDSIRGATVESRAEKLKAILVDVFGLKRLLYRGNEVAVDEELCRRLIRTRNRLFHGSPASQSNRDNLKELADQLIMIGGAILHILLTDSGRTLQDPKNEAL